MRPRESFLKRVDLFLYLPVTELTLILICHALLIFWYQRETIIYEWEKWRGGVEEEKKRNMIPLLKFSGRPKGEGRRGVQLSDLPTNLIEEIIYVVELCTTSCITNSEIEIEWTNLFLDSKELIVRTIHDSAPHVSDSIKNELFKYIVARSPNATPFKFSDTNGRRSYLIFPDAFHLTTEQFFLLARQATDAFVAQNKYVLLSDDMSLSSFFSFRRFIICKKDLSGINTVKGNLLPNAHPATRRHGGMNL